jgi:predicted CXXCH cytochrome family protein
MRKWPWAILLAVVILVGCSPSARDRLKHFFFEIPDESAAAQPAVDVAGAPGTSSSDAVATAGSPSPAPTAFLSIHAPYDSNDCSACHQQDARMSVPKDQSESCGTCHERHFDEDEVMHQPVSEGDCSMCHVPHRSQYKGLLNRPVLTICSDCHEPDDLSEEAHVPPTRDQCTLCHDAHFGEEYLLKPNRPGAPATE